MDEANLARQAEAELQRNGDYDTLFFEGTWHSTGRLADRAARVVGALAELGVRPGDRVVVLMANCPEVFVSYAALWRAGAVATPLIFLTSVDELRHALVDSGAGGQAGVGGHVDAGGPVPARLMVVAGPPEALLPDLGPAVRVVPFAELE